ncbi:MAG TPA: hypothetical protein VKS79_03595 [Gemmataceae bacterium]|nr:hypothetical protein [Gemmataceae bacterium]
MKGRAYLTVIAVLALTLASEVSAVIAQTPMTPVAPLLELEVVHPKSLPRSESTYTVRVTNGGKTPARNVTVDARIPINYGFLQAGEDGQFDEKTRTVHWQISEIDAGQSRDVILRVRFLQPFENQFKIVVRENGRSHAEIVFPGGWQGLWYPLIEVSASERELHIGDICEFEIRITNLMTVPDRTLKLKCIIPDVLEFVSANRPTSFVRKGREINFEPITELRPRDDTYLRVKCKAKEPGKAIFRVRMSSMMVEDETARDETTSISKD